MPTDLNLVFGKPRYAGGPLDLVFGEGFVAPVLPSTVTGTSSLGPALVSSGVTFYDNKNPKQVGTSAAAPFQRAKVDEVLMGAAWTVATRAAGEPAAGWQGASRTEATPGLPWVQSREVQRQWAVAWAETQTRETLRRVAHQDTIKLHRQAAAPWGEGRSFDRVARAPHQVATPADRLLLVSASEARALEAMALARHHIARAAGKTLVAPWQLGRVIPPGLSVYVPPGGPGTTPRVIDLNLVFCHPAYTGGPINLVFGRTCGGVDPVDPGTIVVPIRSVYMTVNSLALVRVSDGAVVPASGFGMELSADSWTWSWSATVQGKAMALFAPELGEPVELAATVNGVEFRLLADQVGRTRRFGEDALAVSGLGLAGALDAPYSPTLNFSAAADRTAQQLATEALTLNGESIGWTVDWGLEDWLVPGGVWSHQGSYISAVNAIAAAAGGYVQPHRTARTLRVLHRYPVAPWDWAGVTPDVVLPSAPVIVEGMKWSSKPGYNRVHVSGQGSGGLGEVTRGGTAGDVSAPMVVDQLITAVAAARQRGRAVLSNTGRQALVTLSLPVLGETGPILPGTFLQYVDGAATRRGIVRGYALSWDRPRLRQQITVETHEIA